MQLSKLLSSIISLSLVSKVVAAPFDKFDQLDARDDDEGPVVVHLTKTVHNVVTNTQVVKGEVSTITDTIMNEDTTTTTRYTATVTSTVFGTPLTYTTVASTPIDTGNIKVPTETETSTSQAEEEEEEEEEKDDDDNEEKEPETTKETTKTSAKPSSSSSTPKETEVTTTSKTEAETTEAETTTSETLVPETSNSNDGPTITDAANIPSSTGSWIIDNVTTSKSNGVCEVDYDYYATGEPEETSTSTKTITRTVTQT